MSIEATSSSAANGMESADITFRPARPRYPIEANWPANVWSIGLDRLDYLGVDDGGHLYWDGKPIEFRKPLILTIWQRIGTVIVAASAAVGAAAAAVSAYADIARTAL